MAKTTAQKIAEKIKKNELLAIKLQELEKKAQQIKDENPFTFFQPSDGIVSSEKMAFLKRWLKPEDIPQKFDSQVDIFRSLKPIRMGFGGNRAAKSTTGCLITLISITGEIPEGLQGIYPEQRLFTKTPKVDFRVIGVDKDQTFDTVIPLYEKYTPKKYLANGDFMDSYSAEHGILTLLSPKNKKIIIGTIQFMNNTMKTKKFQGRTVQGMVYDEEPLQTIRKENLLRMATAEHGLFEYFGMTPTLGMTWMTDYFMSGDPRIDTFKLVSITNPIIEVEILEGIISDPTFSYDEIKMRLTGAIISLSGFVYGARFGREHVIKPFEVNKTDYMVYRGLDPHIVKDTVCVELAVDREGHEIVAGVYSKDENTEVVKSDLAERAKGRHYRLGHTSCDTSANSDLKIFGNLNIFKEFKGGKNFIPNLQLSEKYAGSINAGIDGIKKKLVLRKDGLPTLMIMDKPECQLLITAMKTLEKASYPNPDKMGQKDDINESKLDAHAALRYIMQKKHPFIEHVPCTPQYAVENENTNW